MPILPRHYDLSSLVRKNKVLVIYGPRQVGKTTLLRQFLAQTTLKYKLDSGDNIRIQKLFQSQDFPTLLEYAAGYELIALDEAQRIPNIGLGLKILIDEIPNLMVIATGSSSFDLAQKLGEPLTGRKRTIILYPLAQLELAQQCNRFELRQRLETFLIFGAYPEVITATTNQERIALLDELADSYLLKDILALDRLKNPQQLLQLLKLLAFQVGQEVSLNELASQVKLDVKTVGRYLNLLQKAFVIQKLSGFSRNLRQEVVSKAKYYFLDNGIRNAVIRQYNSLSDRNDTGQLFENFVIMERYKSSHYRQQPRNHYFWRTYAGQEIDLIEEEDGHLHGYELKWSPNKQPACPGAWQAAYPEASYQIVHRDNYLDFLEIV